jgi:hypothetical protein
MTVEGEFPVNIIMSAAIHCKKKSKYQLNNNSILMTVEGEFPVNIIMSAVIH